MSRGFNVEKSNFSKSINPLLVYVGQVMFFNLKFVLANLLNYIFVIVNKLFIKIFKAETLKNLSNIYHNEFCMKIKLSFE